MTNDNNQKESGQFESGFEEEFAYSFNNILEDLKKQSISPVVRIFVERIERHGYTISEVLNALAWITFERKWERVTGFLENAASEVEGYLSAEKETPSQTLNLEELEG